MLTKLYKIIFSYIFLSKILGCYNFVMFKGVKLIDWLLCGTSKKTILKAKVEISFLFAILCIGNWHGSRIYIFPAHILRLHRT
jgi:hypothetical protein